MKRNVDYDKSFKVVYSTIIEDDIKALLKGLKGEDFLTRSYRSCVDNDSMIRICRQIVSDYVDNPRMVTSIIGENGIKIILKYLNSTQ